MTAKKLIHNLHLWLGLASGLVVFIVGLTGCLYVFIAEIESVTAPYKRVPVRQDSYLAPTALRTIAAAVFPGKRVRYINYQQGRAAYIALFDKGYNVGVYTDPYTGARLHVKNEDSFDFFSFVLHGHRGLWMPYPIGRPVVDTAILIFIILLLSGLVLWWPKNLRKANRLKSFTIKWKASPKRVNYDLHNVLGFYGMLILLVIAITGSLYGFEWVRSSFYKVTSGGKNYPAFRAPQSDTLVAGSFHSSSLDSLFESIHTKNPGAAFFVFFPDKKPDPIQVTINHQPGKTYDIELLYFDQFTLRKLPGPGIYKEKFQDATLADRISRLNYDIHTGQIGGLPTKVLAFFASLIAASLPITGFYIWWGRSKWGRRRKDRRKGKQQKDQQGNEPKNYNQQNTSNNENIAIRPRPNPSGV